MKLAVFQSASGGLSVPERLTKLAEAITQADCDLMICPELYVSGYNVGDAVRHVAENKSADFIQEAAALAKSTKTALVFGYPELEDSTLYNAALFIDASGNACANHRKLAVPPGFEGDYFAAGNAMTLFDFMGMKCAILICYDAEFPETLRKAAHMGVELVIVPTALVVNWSVVADKVMPTRAFENGVWLAYANHAGAEGDMDYYGHSCIVTPTGEDAARAGFAQQIIAADIDAEAVKIAQNRLPYLRHVKQLKTVL